MRVLKKPQQFQFVSNFACLKLGENTFNCFSCHKPNENFSSNQQFQVKNTSKDL